MNISRRKLLQALALAPGYLASVQAKTISQTKLDIRNPVAAYGESVNYTIYRNGKTIGKHTIMFAADGSSTNIEIESDIVVRVLRVPVYRFNYRSSENWLNGTLQLVTARTNDNGKAHRVSASRSGDSMLLTDRDGKATQRRVAYTSNHWNSQVLDANVLFNTLTGKANNIILRDLGPASVTIDKQTVTANHFRYAGDLQTDVWYDDAGRWVQLRFNGDDGSTIEYRCAGFQL